MMYSPFVMDSIRREIDCVIEINGKKGTHKQIIWRNNAMPVRKVKGGYKYGTVGKVYPTRAQAEKQGRAIKASQARQGKKEK